MSDKKLFVEVGKLWDWIMLNSGCDSVNMWSLKDQIDSLAVEREPEPESLVKARNNYHLGLDKYTIASAQNLLRELEARVKQLEGK